MNARIKKEIWPLLPVFGVTVLGIAACFFTTRESFANTLLFILLPGCAALMGAISFGHEFQARTMPLLLTQPVSRRQLWLEKMLILGLALGLWYAGLILSFQPWQHLVYLREYEELIIISALIPFCVFCTTPCLTLLTKNIIGAIVFTVVLPFTLVALFLLVDTFLAWLFSRPELFFAGSFEKHPLLYIGPAALVYSVLFYCAGYRKFMRFQAVDSQGREISIPAGMETALAPALKRLVPGYTGPIASLIRKELQLQRVNYILAAGMSLLLFCLAMAWKMHHADAIATSMVAFLFTYMLIIPIIIGVVSVAEERNLGTLGWQLTLPVSPLKQWTVKTLVALATGALLGWIVPCLLLVTGEWLLTGLPVRHFISELPHGFALMFYVFCYVCLLSLVIFASSLATNSTRAITLAFGLVIASLMTIGLTTARVEQILKRSWFQLDVNAEFQIIAIVSLLGLVILWFTAFFNYRTGELNLRRCWVQSAWLLVLVCGATLTVIAVGFIVLEGRMPRF